MDPEQDGSVCVCVCWGEGGGSGEENSVVIYTCDIEQTLYPCILLPKRVSCNFPRDIAQKQIQ